VTLAGAGMATGPTQQFLEAKVEVIEPTGADTLAVLDLGGTEFTARLEPDIAMAPGQQMRFVVDLAKLVAFDPESESLIA
jgi:multiple sugar transport system ATP-binding protein